MYARYSSRRLDHLEILLRCDWLFKQKLTYSVLSNERKHAVCFYPA